MRFLGVKLDKTVHAAGAWKSSLHSTDIYFHFRLQIFFINTPVQKSQRWAKCVLVTGDYIE